MRKRRTIDQHRQTHVPGTYSLCVLPINIILLHKLHVQKMIKTFSYNNAICPKELSHETTLSPAPRLTFCCKATHGWALRCLFARGTKADLKEREKKKEKQKEKENDKRGFAITRGDQEFGQFPECSLHSCCFCKEKCLKGVLL